MNQRTVAVIMMVFFLLCGCYTFMESHTRLYSGERQTRENVSFLFPEIGDLLFSIDGTKVKQTSISKWMELLPGTHVFQFSPYAGSLIVMGSGFVSGMQQASDDAMSESLRKSNLKGSEYVQPRPSSPPKQVDTPILKDQPVDFATLPGHIYALKGNKIKEGNKDVLRISIDDVTGKEPYEKYLKQLFNIYRIEH